MFGKFCLRYSDERGTDSKRLPSSHLCFRFVAFIVVFIFQKIDYCQSNHYDLLNEIINHVCVLIRSSQTLLENRAGKPAPWQGLVVHKVCEVRFHPQFSLFYLAGCKKRVKGVFV